MMLDCGSSHGFVSPHFADKLPAQPMMPHLKKNIASNEKITMVEVCTKPKLGKGFHQNTGAISSFQDMFGQQHWSPQVW